jgi:hypothetical protein
VNYTTVHSIAEWREPVRATIVRCWRGQCIQKCAEHTGITVVAERVAEQKMMSEEEPICVGFGDSVVQYSIGKRLGRMAEELRAQLGKEQAPTVDIETSVGNFKAELYWSHAPRTCRNFAQVNCILHPPSLFLFFFAQAFANVLRCSSLALATTTTSLSTASSTASSSAHYRNSILRSASTSPDLLHALLYATKCAVARRRPHIHWSRRRIHLWRQIRK